MTQELPPDSGPKIGRNKINAFLLVLDTMMASGLVTLEKVQVRQYGANSAARGD